jgi:hypothetical protein
VAKVGPTGKIKQFGLSCLPSYPSLIWGQCSVKGKVSFSMTKCSLGVGDIMLQSTKHVAKFL